ncbi:hypothetical protein ACQYAD_08750 [Neobacillus sp. SM06]
MGEENQYVAAQLSPNAVNELKLFENKLAEQTNKKLVVIAYEKDED